MTTFDNEREIIYPIVRSSAIEKIEIEIEEKLNQGRIPSGRKAIKEDVLYAHIKLLKKPIILLLNVLLKLIQ